MELCHSRWFYYQRKAETRNGKFWNYVIPDGSTTAHSAKIAIYWFWNYVIPDGSTTSAQDAPEYVTFWNYVIPDGSTTRARYKERLKGFGTMSFQMVLLRFENHPSSPPCFGTMSFQMVLLQTHKGNHYVLSFGTMSFQMVLLPAAPAPCRRVVLELCHSRWFYYNACELCGKKEVLELCHSRWFYY